MKKAFILLLLTAGMLSACSPQNIQADQPTAVQKVISQKETESSSTTQPAKLGQASTDQPEESTVLESSSQNKTSDASPTTPTKPNSQSFSSWEPSTEPDPTVKASTEPATIETKPVIVESSDTVPQDTVPPTTTEPSVTEPPVTVPPSTEPSTSEPPVTEPPSTEPPVTVPPETEPAAEPIDTYALESYARSYASSTYGYNGTSACHPGSGAGYFPAATQRIDSMEEGYSIVCQAIDSQYYRDIAYGYLPYEEVDGVIVRCPINVSVSSTGESGVFTITVYYGGLA